jgi:endonuclease YncB( thermonuclease family)
LLALIFVGNVAVFGACDRVVDAPAAVVVVDGGLGVADGVADAGKKKDAEIAEEEEQAPAGPCEPGVLSPDQVPAGFLPPQKVTLRRNVDGDTAHFDFPGKADQVCRFLFVNTEESHGDETTNFGIQTAGIVAGYLKAAKEIVVAIREKSGSPGTPDVDTYGRNLALVWVDGDLFQTRLVREGLSAYYTQFGCAPEPVHRTLVGAEMVANEADVGIWKAGHPTDYKAVLYRWIGSNHCRPNPFSNQPYCEE